MQTIEQKTRFRLYKKSGYNYNRMYKEGYNMLFITLHNYVCIIITQTVLVQRLVDEYVRIISLGKEVGGKIK